MSDSRILLGILPDGEPRFQLIGHGFDFATLTGGAVLALKIDPEEDHMRDATRALEAAGADPVILANQCPHLKALWLSGSQEETTE
jgi:hypothetical protein